MVHALPDVPRQIVAIGTIAYVGNHGGELLRPGATRAEVDPDLAAWTARVRAFAAVAYTTELARLRVRSEDKEAIAAFHWRGAPDEQAAAEAGSGARAWVLFILIVVYTFNFVDRQILGILIGPIKAELHLSDLQLGLLGGPAFTLSSMETSGVTALEIATEALRAGEIDVAIVGAVDFAGDVRRSGGYAVACRVCLELDDDRSAQVRRITGGGGPRMQNVFLRARIARRILQDPEVSLEWVEVV